MGFASWRSHGGHGQGSFSGEGPRILQSRGIWGLGLFYFGHKGVGDFRRPEDLGDFSATLVKRYLKEKEKCLQHFHESTWLGRDL